MVFILGGQIVTTLLHVYDDLPRVDPVNQCWAKGPAHAVVHMGDGTIMRDGYRYLVIEEP